MSFQKSGPEKIIYEGKIFQVVEQPMTYNGHNKTFELARRSPGTRLIIIKDNRILITKEFRSEHGKTDYRLPGGKVFDSLEEYKKYLNDDLLPFAEIAAKKECLEETGLIPKNIKHFSTSKAGATIEWDLYYFIVDDFEINLEGQRLETGEDIEIEWKTFEEVKKLCTQGLINEDRTIGVLFKFFLQQT